MSSAWRHWGNEKASVGWWMQIKHRNKNTVAHAVMWETVTAESIYWREKLPWRGIKHWILGLQILYFTKCANQPTCHWRSILYYIYFILIQQLIVENIASMHNLFAEPYRLCVYYYVLLWTCVFNIVMGVCTAWFLPGVEQEECSDETHSVAQFVHFQLLHDDATWWHPWKGGLAVM